MFCSTLERGLPNVSQVRLSFLRPIVPLCLPNGNPAIPGNHDPLPGIADRSCPNAAIYAGARRTITKNIPGVFPGITRKMQTIDLSKVVIPQINYLQTLPDTNTNLYPLFLGKQPDSYISDKRYRYEFFRPDNWISSYPYSFPHPDGRQTELFMVLFIRLIPNLPSK